MNRKRKSTRAFVSVALVVTWVALGLMTGTRRVSAATFTVTNTSDNGGVNPAPGAGTGTLRQAIVDANAAAGADTINFAAGVTGTITLASALPQITQDVMINGPGANMLTVSGATLYQVFNIASGVTASISGLTISNGRSIGGIANAGTLTVTNCTLFGNSTSGFGGGISNDRGTVTVTNSNLILNSAGGDGGGINNFQGTVTVTNSTLSDNIAFNGGGINNIKGTVTVTNSTLSGNRAVDGGGIANSGTLTVTNSTLSGNVVEASGGGIVNSGTLTVTNSTLASNAANIGGGGGILNNGTASAKNSIIANSSGGGNCAGNAITTVGVNFSTDNDCGGFTTVIPAQLKLGSLQDNGGPTLTHALLPGSVAIDAATDCTDLSAVPAPVTTDQRGFARPKDGDGNGAALCDAGAFEFQPCTVTCSANISKSNDPQQCAAVVTYPAPTTSGDVGCGTVACSPSSGSFFPVGTTTVTCTATDGSGNTGTCTFTVTVNDTQPPSITCPANVTAVSAVACPPTSATAVTYPPPTVSDNCPSVTVACNPPSGSPLPVGTTTVTCTATDASMNTATCSFTVTVFNGRLQDDSNPQSVLLFNTTTGDYTLCCGGMVLSGKGTPLLKGCVFSLQHNPTNRRLLVNVDFAQKKGTAALQFPPGSIKCTITDRNMADDTSTCP